MIGLVSWNILLFCYEIDDFLQLFERLLHVRFGHVRDETRPVGFPIEKCHPFLYCWVFSQLLNCWNKPNDNRIELFSWTKEKPTNLNWFVNFEQITSFESFSIFFEFFTVLAHVDPNNWMPQWKSRLNKITSRYNKIRCCQAKTPKWNELKHNDCLKRRLRTECDSSGLLSFHSWISANVSNWDSVSQTNKLSRLTNRNWKFIDREEKKRIGWIMNEHIGAKIKR